jgi:predicted DCC family thiol-disulfide oxidoreductase YuxK
MGELTVLYDESCPFCTGVALWLARRVAIEAAPIGSETGDRLLRDLGRTERYASVHVVDALGRRRSAGAALPPLLRQLPRCAPAAAVCEALPGATERAYRLVSRHRGLASGMVVSLQRERACRPVNGARSITGCILRHFEETWRRLA